MIWLDMFQTCIHEEFYNPESMAILVLWMEGYQSNYHKQIHNLQLPRIYSSLLDKIMFCK